jgi:ATP-dependent helicase/nuclease subunit A
MAGLLDRDKADKGLRWLMDWNNARDQILGVASWQSGDPLNDTVMRALTDDRRQAKDEDFNLLYVGATRAKRFLLFSAAQGAKETDTKWFSQISSHCSEWPLGELSDLSHAAQEIKPAPSWPGQDFPKPATLSAAADDPALTADTLAIRKGKALHRLLEFGPTLAQSAIARLIAPFALPAAAHEEILAALHTLGQSSWAQEIFRTDRLSYAEREWPVEDAGRIILMRPDRVVRVAADPECWWIIDFKWQVLPSELADYAQQLSGYQNAFQTIRPQAQIQAKILTAQGQVWQLDPAAATGARLKLLQ